MILNMSAAIVSQRQTWKWTAALWSCAALFYATETVFGMRAEGMHHAWSLLFLTDFLFWLPWALATPIVLRLGRRPPPGTKTRWTVWLVHAAAVTVIQAILAAWRAGMLVLWNPYANPDGPGQFKSLWFATFHSGLFGAMLLYAMIVAAGHILADRQRLARQEMETARLNEQLSQARLDALRRQIEPHFLFNSLNSIAGLVRENRNDAAVTTIARLSDFLRRAIDGPNRQMAPLAEEMAFLEPYLEIQKVRFAERLQLNVDIPNELLSDLVPTLMLQPMVENAIKHGIGKRAQAGAIRISASRGHGMLTIGVENDGPPLPDDWDSGRSGVGLAIVRARLRSLYGSDSGLSVRNREPSGVAVSISVPVHRS
jgi:two-component system LytT family sensor kinase